MTDVYSLLKNAVEDIVQATGSNERGTKKAINDYV